MAQDGAYAGWSLYLHEGRPAYCYNFFGLQRFKVYGEQPVSAGEHQIRLEFAYDGGGLGKGGDVTLYVDGDKLGEGRVEHTVPMLFSADETLDLGFTGRVRWVQIDIDEAAEDLDHQISTDERLRIAMARQ